MKINQTFLPIKGHFFFFMAAMGPILPQLPLFGKDLKISPVVMGTVTGVLPFTFLLTKPLFGLVTDVYREYRKAIFITLIIIMSLAYSGIYFILPRQLSTEFEISKNTSLVECASSINITNFVICNSTCSEKSVRFPVNSNLQVCRNSLWVYEKLELNATCRFVCNGDPTSNNESLTFWLFIVFMCVGTIGFNVVNSISDAICFDVVGEQENYGKQRLWGSIGFGLAGLIAGYVVDISSSYAPAFIAMLILSVLDIFVCRKLQLPVIEAPKNIIKDLKVLLTDKHVITFITFTVLAGILDSLIVYFLFWYLEDLAFETHTTNVKLIEGLILAAETLGAEVLFFFVSGKILQRLGHVHSFTLCFFNYALRLGLIALAPSPWWLLPTELFLQGPTYALMYTAIVAYANELAPPGMSATMQGIAAGMGDGTGYAIGSILGGLSYLYLGGKTTFQVFAGLAIICSILHFVLYLTVLKARKSVRRNDYEEIG